MKDLPVIAKNDSLSVGVGEEASINVLVNDIVPNEEIIAIESLDLTNLPLGAIVEHDGANVMVKIDETATDAAFVFKYLLKVEPTCTNLALPDQLEALVVVNDKTAPTVDKFEVVYNYKSTNTEWIGKEDTVLLHFEGRDNMGINEVEVYHVDSSGSQVFVGLMKLVTEQTSTNPAIFELEVNANGSYFAIVKDSSLNSVNTDRAAVDKIDRIKPTIIGTKPTFEGMEYGWIDDNVAYILVDTLDVADDEGIASGVFVKDKNDIVQIRANIMNEDDSEGREIDVAISEKTQRSRSIISPIIEVKFDIADKVKLTVPDYAGNELTYTFDYRNLKPDTENPEFNMTHDDPTNNHQQVYVDRSLEYIDYSMKDPSNSDNNVTGQIKEITAVDQNGNRISFNANLSDPLHYRGQGRISAFVEGQGSAESNIYDINAVDMVKREGQLTLEVLPIPDPRTFSIYEDDSQIKRIVTEAAKDLEYVWNSDQQLVEARKNLSLARYQELATLIEANDVSSIYMTLRSAYDVRYVGISAKETADIMAAYGAIENLNEQTKALITKDILSYVTNAYEAILTNSMNQSLQELDSNEKIALAVMNLASLSIVELQYIDAEVISAVNDAKASMTDDELNDAKLEVIRTQRTALHDIQDAIVTLSMDTTADFTDDQKEYLVQESAKINQEITAKVSTWNQTVITSANAAAQLALYERMSKREQQQISSAVLAQVISRVQGARISVRDRAGLNFYVSDADRSSYTLNTTVNTLSTTETVYHLKLLRNDVSIQEVGEKFTISLPLGDMNPATLKLVEEVHGETVNLKYNVSGTMIQFQSAYVADSYRVSGEIKQNPTHEVNPEEEKSVEWKPKKDKSEKSIIVSKNDQTKESSTDLESSKEPAINLGGDLQNLAYIFCYIPIVLAILLGITDATIWVARRKKDEREAK